MWRLWTLGWGPKDWWHWMRTERVPMLVAWALPSRIAYWAFIRVYASDGECPGPEYVRVSDHWAGKYGLY